MYPYNTLHEVRSNSWVGWCSWDDETLRWVSSCILATSLLKFSTTVKLFMSISMSFLMSSKPPSLFFVTNSARDSCMFWHNRVQHLVQIQLPFLFICSSRVCARWKQQNHEFENLPLQFKGMLLKLMKFYG